MDLRPIHFKLVGGNPALDFTNTVDWYQADPLSDSLTSYPVLVAWAREVGLIDDDEANRLFHHAIADKEAGRAILARAVRLRGAIYRIFDALSLDRPAPEEAVAILNEELARAMAQARIEPEGDHFHWRWAGEEDALERVLWPIARAAADLLTSEDRSRVHECGGDQCSWLFLDKSRNQTRRWCDMGGCGNRAKARRHYSKRKMGESA